MRKKLRRNKTDKDGYEYNFDGVNSKHLRTVPDPPWLPSPKEIARIMKYAKVTILLDLDSVEFFKKEARKHKASYQGMIREVVRNYTRQHRNAA